MGKKKKGFPAKKGLAEWMATYSDMISLLMCFFIILYATSSSDPVRVQYILEAFTSGGKYLNTVVGMDPDEIYKGDERFNSDIPPLIEGDTSGAMGSSDVFNELYTALQDVIESNNLSDSVSVDGNGGQIRIRFKNDILFDADSYTLKESGRKALGLLSPSIKAIDRYISLVVVQGHTAKVQGVSAVNDWDLSCMRSSTVTKYLEYTRTVSTEKLKAEGLGPNMPIDDSDTEEAKAKNRRVDIIINRNKDLQQDAEVFKSIMEYDYNQRYDDIDDDGNVIDDDFLNPEDVVSGIASAIDSRYSGKEGQSDEDYQSPVGPGAGGNILETSDEDYVVTEAEITEEAEVSEEETED